MNDEVVRDARRDGSVRVFVFLDVSLRLRTVRVVDRFNRVMKIKSCLDQHVSGEVRDKAGMHIRAVIEVNG